jgi:hypothetical protein
LKKLDEMHKVFGIGLSRTGTASLAEALNMLGINTIHYPHDSQTFDELEKGQYKLSILKKYQGITDITVAPYYVQLDQSYPRSKFILTIRNKSDWLTSIENHLRVLESNWDKFETQFKKFTLFINASIFGAIKFNKERFLHVYEAHFKNVCDYFKDRPQDLLLYDIADGDGWEKLCPFLDIDPPNVKFPHRNLSLANTKWKSWIDLANCEIRETVPDGDTLILATDSTFTLNNLGRRQLIPFLEREGKYWGPPPDDNTAIHELERLRQSGASFVAFAWPAFWWLDYYAEFLQYLRSKFPCVLENDRLVVFDLRA